MLQRSRPNLQPASFVRRCGGRDTNRGPQSRLPSLYKCRGARMRGYSSRHQASLFTPGFNPITPHTSHTSTTTSLYSKYFQSHIHSPKRDISNMASATSVFDFKPLNSKSPPSHVQFAPVCASYNTNSPPRPTAIYPYHPSAMHSHCHLACPC